MTGGHGTGKVKQHRVVVGIPELKLWDRRAWDRRQVILVVREGGSDRASEAETDVIDFRARYETFNDRLGVSLSDAKITILYIAQKFIYMDGFFSVDVHTTCSHQSIFYFSLSRTLLHILYYFMIYKGMMIQVPSPRSLPKPKHHNFPLQLLPPQLRLRQLVVSFRVRVQPHFRLDLNSTLIKCRSDLVPDYYYWRRRLDFFFLIIIITVIDDGRSRGQKKVFFALLRRRRKGGEEVVGSSSA